MDLHSEINNKGLFKADVVLKHEFMVVMTLNSDLKRAKTFI